MIFTVSSRKYKSFVPSRKKNRDVQVSNTEFACFNLHKKANLKKNGKEIYKYPDLFGRFGSPTSIKFIDFCF